MAIHDFVLINNKVAIQLDNDKFIIPKVTSDGKFISEIKIIKKKDEK